jgi:hypothetical protein
MKLVVAPCDHNASKHAVMNWHYSKAMPSGKLIKFGVWENDTFVGSIIYGRGATPELGSPYGLDQVEVCELVRVALTRHTTPVSQIIAITIEKVKQTNPGLRLVVSFADSAQGHHGGIYQAGNWLYLGQSIHHRIRIKGELIHPRSLGAKYGRGGQSIPWLKTNVDRNAERVTVPGKHRYVFPLDKQMRRQLAKLAMPYPANEGLTVSHTSSRSEV